MLIKCEAREDGWFFGASANRLKDWKYWWGVIETEDCAFYLRCILLPSWLRPISWFLFTIADEAIKGSKLARIMCFVYPLLAFYMSYGFTKTFTLLFP